MVSASDDVIDLIRLEMTMLSQHEQQAWALNHTGYPAPKYTGESTK